MDEWQAKRCKPRLVDQLQPLAAAKRTYPVSVMNAAQRLFRFLQQVDHMGFVLGVIRIGVEYPYQIAQRALALVVTAVVGVLAIGFTHV